MSESPTFCIFPFIHLETRAAGHIAPCCVSLEAYKKDNGQDYNAACGDSLNDAWNSNSIKNLRKELLDGKKPANCDWCWKEEEAGRASRRIRANEEWGTEWKETPKVLDLKLGTICNLKCRICGPGSSSLWVKEQIDIYNEPKSNFANTSTWPNVNIRFWDDLYSYLPTVESFLIYGGEPFLIQKQFDLLKRSVDLGYSKNQRIEYITNGTIYPDDAMKDIFPYFKRVSIALSIDGIGEQFEYQRYPAKWVEVEKNLDLFISNSRVLKCLPSIILSVSALNIFYLPEYLNYFKERNLDGWAYLNMVYWKDFFSIENLPRSIKNRIQDKIQNTNHHAIPGIINVMNAKSDKNLINELKENLRVHDEYRKQSYAAVFPEFAELLFNWKPDDV